MTRMKTFDESRHNASTVFLIWMKHILTFSLALLFKKNLKAKNALDSVKELQPSFSNCAYI